MIEDFMRLDLCPHRNDVHTDVFSGVLTKQIVNICEVTRFRCCTSKRRNYYGRKAQTPVFNN